MAPPAEGLPMVALPGRLDRRLRLGPFASGRDALKFLACAAVAAALSAASLDLLGGTVLGLGAVVALWKPDGESLDDRLVVRVRYAARRLRPERGMNGPTVRPSRSTDLVATGTGRWAAVLRTGGVPLAFLPPAELARRFELFRDLLRSLDAELRVVAEGAPIHAASVVPPSVAPRAPDAAARAGYAELVGLLCRRRSVRRVYLGLTSAGTREEAAGRLEVAALSVGDRLAALGLRAERLRGRTLVAGAQRLGWRAGSRT